MDPSEVERVPQGKGKAADATISRHEVGVLYRPVARFLKARAGASRQAKEQAGSKCTYERGDVVETPLGMGMIDTDPDERGRCMVVPERPLEDGTTRFSATTFQFGRIIRKRNAGQPAIASTCHLSRAARMRTRVSMTGRRIIHSFGSGVPSGNAFHGAVLRAADQGSSGVIQIGLDQAIWRSAWVTRT